jgi:hypothetical protein
VTYEQRITQITIPPKGEPIYSERAWTVTIETEAAGEFLQVASKTMHTQSKNAEVQIDSDEWPALRDGIEFMLRHCREEA